MDSIRALVVAAMVIPGIGLPWLCILVAVMSFLGGSYKAAQLAFLRDVLSAERYPVGMALRQTTTRTAVLAGSSLGEFSPSPSALECVSALMPPPSPRPPC